MAKSATQEVFIFLFTEDISGPTYQLHNLLEITVLLNLHKALFMFPLKSLDLTLYASDILYFEEINYSIQPHFFFLLNV